MSKLFGSGLKLHTTLGEVAAPTAIDLYAVPSQSQVIGAQLGIYRFSSFLSRTLGPSQLLLWDASEEAVRAHYQAGHQRGEHTDSHGSCHQIRGTGGCCEIFWGFLYIQSFRQCMTSGKYALTYVNRTGEHYGSCRDLWATQWKRVTVETHLPEISVTRFWKNLVSWKSFGIINIFHGHVTSIHQDATLMIIEKKNGLLFLMQTDWNTLRLTKLNPYALHFNHWRNSD